MLDYSNAQSSLLELVKLSPLTFDRALSIEEFTTLAEHFPNVRMEREKNGKVTLMCPVKKGSGSRQKGFRQETKRVQLGDKKGPSSA